MRTRVISWTEAILEELFAVLGITDSIYYYLSYPMKKYELLLAHCEREPYFPEPEYHTLLDAYEYIKEFDLEQGFSETTLHAVAERVLLDRVWKCFEALELYQRCQELERQAV